MLLIIDQDNHQSIEIKKCLQKVSTHCEISTSIANALYRCTHEYVPVVVLALNRPLLDCVDEFRLFVRQAVDSAVIIVGTSGCEAERILSLELGAQDYLDYPCNPAELQARVRVQLRRVSTNAAPYNDTMSIHIGEFRIDHNYRQASVQGIPLSLTATEFDLLYFLASHPDQVFTRANLLTSVWGYEYSGYEHTVNSHINRLRSKLDRVLLAAKLVETVWGVGYKFNSSGAINKPHLTASLLRRA